LLPAILIAIAIAHAALAIALFVALSKEICWGRRTKTKE
jgi:hypothetical protein